MGEKTMETIKKPDELDLDELLIYTKVDDPLVYSPRTLEAYPHQTLETNHLLRPPCSAVHREHRRGGFRVLRRFHAHALTIGKTKCQSCISRCMDKQSPASVKQGGRDLGKPYTRTFAYSTLFLNMAYACEFAASPLFGLSSSSCTPTKICFTVIDGFQALSSFKMLRHTFPEG